MLVESEKTLSIIKPDGVRKGLIGKIIDRFESKGIIIVAMKMLSLSESEASAFYTEHNGKPFFANLIRFMTSGPIVVSVLEGKGVVSLNRELMGHTDPKKAGNGTIRGDFATIIDENVVHGSDSLSSAKREIEFFFPAMFS